MAKGRAAAIVLEAAEKRELRVPTRPHSAPQALAEWRVLFWLRTVMLPLRRGAWEHVERYAIASSRCMPTTS